MVTKEQALTFAARRSGCKWEVVEEEMAALDLFPANWPVPLTQEGVRAAPLGRGGRASRCSTGAHCIDTVNDLITSFAFVCE